MPLLSLFLHYLCGEFDNRQQLFDMDPQKAAGFPLAIHKNSIFQDRIFNLPQNFSGCFILEESYYTIDGHDSAQPHLFLFRENPQGNIVLTSYQAPAGFENKNQKFDYNSLVLSEKFAPLTYAYGNGEFAGECVSRFSPVLTFTLKERVAKDLLSVHETMEVNGRRTFGWDAPILYRRINAAP